MAPSKKNNPTYILLIDIVFHCAYQDILEVVKIVIGLTNFLLTSFCVFTITWQAANLCNSKLC